MRSQIRCDDGIWMKTILWTTMVASMHTDVSDSCCCCCFLFSVELTMRRLVGCIAWCAHVMKCTNRSHVDCTGGQKDVGLVFYRVYDLWQRSPTFLAWLKTTMTSTRTIFVKLSNKRLMDHLWRHDNDFVIGYMSNKVTFAKVPNNEMMVKQWLRRIWPNRLKNKK